jgi:hypothetical protein
MDDPFEIDMSVLEPTLCYKQEHSRKGHFIRAAAGID